MAEVGDLGTEGGLDVADDEAEGTADGPLALGDEEDEDAEAGLVAAREEDPLGGMHGAVEEKAHLLEPLYHRDIDGLPRGLHHCGRWAAVSAWPGLFGLFVKVCRGDADVICRVGVRRGFLPTESPPSFLLHILLSLSPSLALSLSLSLLFVLETHRNPLVRADELLCVLLQGMLVRACKVDHHSPPLDGSEELFVVVTRHPLPLFEESVEEA
mmetsp:Transcript_7177/g.30580  ORF Transcript_7177/g.30580 Transcript_7177/m.30580 type:complete len:213 (+) Transcript_7177:2526-3164(+)